MPFNWLVRLESISITVIFKNPEKSAGSPEDGTTVGQNKVKCLLWIALETCIRSICSFFFHLFSLDCYLMPLVCWWILDASFLTPHLFFFQCKELSSGWFYISNTAMWVTGEREWKHDRENSRRPAARELWCMILFIRPSCSWLGAFKLWSIGPQTSLKSKADTVCAEWEGNIWRH